MYKNKSELEHKVVEITNQNSKKKQHLFNNEYHLRDP